MQIGMIGLGRMGANMVRRLLKGGHTVVVFDVNAKAVSDLAAEGATASSSVADLCGKLAGPRHVWLMLPVAFVDSTIAEVARHLAKGDCIIDGGNSHYIDDIRRAKELEAKGLLYVDVGVSGGVWGLERVSTAPSARSRPASARSPATRTARSSAPPRAATCTAARSAPATS
jgi:6-phosphogluconate dehydrogenase